MPMPCPHNGKFDTTAWNPGVGGSPKATLQKGGNEAPRVLHQHPLGTEEALSKHVRTYFNNILVHFISLLSSQRAFGKQSGLMQLSSADGDSGQVLLAPRWPSMGRSGVGWGG